MNRYFIPLVLTLLLIPNFINAQEAELPKIQFGINVGPNLGWIKPHTEDYSSEGVVMGFAWGFITDFNFSNNYGISSGFNVVYNNGKLKYPYLQDTISGIMQRKYNLQALEIPVVLKMRTKQRHLVDAGLETCPMFTGRGPWERPAHLRAACRADHGQAWAT